MWPILIPMVIGALAGAARAKHRDKNVLGGAAKGAALGALTYGAGSAVGGMLGGGAGAGGGFGGMLGGGSGTSGAAATNLGLLNSPGFASTMGPLGDFSAQALAGSGTAMVPSAGVSGALPAAWGSSAPAWLGTAQRAMRAYQVMQGLQGQGGGMQGAGGGYLPGPQLAGMRPQQGYPQQYPPRECSMQARMDELLYGVDRGCRSAGA